MQVRDRFGQEKEPDNYSHRIIHKSNKLVRHRTCNWVRGLLFLLSRANEHGD